MLPLVLAPPCEMGGVDGLRARMRFPPTLAMTIVRRRLDMPRLPWRGPVRARAQSSLVGMLCACKMTGRPWLSTPGSSLDLLLSGLLRPLAFRITGCLGGVLCMLGLRVFLGLAVSVGGVLDPLLRDGLLPLRGEVSPLPL